MRDYPAGDVNACLCGERAVLGGLAPNCVDRVCFQTVDLIFFQPIDIVRFDPRRGLRSHLIDCPAQPRTERNCPPLVSRAQRLKTIFRRHFAIGDAAVVEQMSNRFDVVNAIPGVECAVKIRPLPLDRRLPT